jgi:hypothetical protein
VPPHAKLSRIPGSQFQSFLNFWLDFVEILGVRGGEKVGQWSGGLVLLRGGVKPGHWIG